MHGRETGGPSAKEQWKLLAPVLGETKEYDDQAVLPFLDAKVFGGVRVWGYSGGECLASAKNIHPLMSRHSLAGATTTLTSDRTRRKY